MRVTKAMYRVLCKMQQGTTLFSHEGRRWMDCTFEAGVRSATFYALIRHGLITPSRRTSAVGPIQRRWKLTEKGKRV